MRLLLLFLLTAPLSPNNRASASDDNGKLEQQAFDAATEAVADCVVQIRTVGGLEQVGDQVLSQGPTTGLIIHGDGYIVSSAINFAQQPTSILVRLPDGKQAPAKLIGHDTNRMLVLLKVDVDEQLPVPETASLAGVRVGDWAIAVGRTYDAARVNVSVGVVSGLGRMFGRAIQTDANASAANYGGPLVDIQGRVLGVLVPMAPQAGGAAETNELAGAEYYDSGIAFAVPLEHILAVLDRWVDAKDLKRGLLGVGMAEGETHSTPPKLTAVWPRSPAAAAGWKPDDVIIAVDGRAIESQSQLRFITAPRYAGDVLKMTIRRGEGDDAKEIESEVTLAAELPPYRHAFLGVLPAYQAAASESADDSEESKDASKGIAVRVVWPGSPAAKAGLKPGDRITRLGDENVASQKEALAQINAHNPGDELAIAVHRGDEDLELTTKLSELPTDVLSTLDLPAVEATAAPDAPANGDPSIPPPLALAELKIPDLPKAARYYKPEGEGRPLGLVMWLTDGDEKHNQALAAAWRETCDRDRLVLVMPAPAEAKGWSSDDLEALAHVLVTAMERFDVDPPRVVVGGEGKAGQLAYALGFKGRNSIRGIAVVDSPLPRTLELPKNAPGARTAVLSVETSNAPLTMLIHKDLKKMNDAGFAASQVVRRTVPSGDGQLDPATLATVARWIDGLDRF